MELIYKGIKYMLPVGENSSRLSGAAARTGVYKHQ